jgi:hypothetical protein
MRLLCQQMQNDTSHITLSHFVLVAVQATHLRILPIRRP